MLHTVGVVRISPVPGNGGDEHPPSRPGMTPEAPNNALTLRNSLLRMTCAARLHLELAVLVDDDGFVQEAGLVAQFMERLVGHLCTNAVGAIKDNFLVFG